MDRCPECNSSRIYQDRDRMGGPGECYDCKLRWHYVGGGFAQGAHYPMGPGAPRPTEKYE